ncbi:low-density lipoprotein receptor-related protein 8-like isoform X2 [Littorina saxatilis]|uniref:low-density lipoprotein receptor-related protein 8-like isoform X2 n=1 Tax=Littorina saxatilis TaxID=31220 RepID=UPI0038B517D7
MTDLHSDVAHDVIMDAEPFTDDRDVVNPMRAVFDGRDEAECLNDENTQVKCLLQESDPQTLNVAERATNDENVKHGKVDDVSIDVHGACTSLDQQTPTKGPASLTIGKATTVNVGENVNVTHIENNVFNQHYYGSNTSCCDSTRASYCDLQTDGSIADGLVVDGSHNKLFYTDSQRHVIASMNLDGSGEQVVISDQLDQPRAIVLDTDNSVLYWTNWGSNPKIERANYDGSNRQTLLSTSIKLPNGLELDKTNGMLYFCDAGTHTIETVTTSGQNRTVIYNDLGAHFFGLALTRQHLYYSDWNRVGLMRLNRDGTGLTTAGPPSFTLINNIITSESLN